YVALSYCWGPPPGSAFKLTATTVDSLSQGIMVSQLPRTIQDAIHICRKFGFQYLWVDSVCIMQDDPKAWRYESEKMGSIYQGSAISIAALHAEDNNGGCFAKREPLKNISLHFPPRSTHILSSHVMSDGWAFQELLLAPRTLYFGSHGIYWDCRQARRNDLFPRGVPEMSSEEWNSPIGIRPWQEIVKYYSRLKLTYSTDKLVAIAGIVELVKAANRTLACAVVNYSAGIWAYDFPEQLLWY
ncbi:HET-domain-containing protein, partial [Hyaloscypha variabilis F]